MFRKYERSVAALPRSVVYDCGCHVFEPHLGEQLERHRPVGARRMLVMGAELIEQRHDLDNAD